MKAGVKTTIIVLTIVCAWQVGECLKPFEKSFGMISKQGIIYGTNYYDGGLKTKSLIYGLECTNDNCDGRQFVGVIFREGPVPSVNRWAKVKALTGDVKLKCPKKSGFQSLDVRDGQALLSCGTLMDGFQFGRRKKTLRIGSSQKALQCPEGFYVTEVQCKGFNCEVIGLTCTLVNYVPKPPLWLPIPHVGSRMRRTYWTGDAVGQETPTVADPIIGVECNDIADESCANRRFTTLSRGEEAILNLEALSPWIGQGSASNPETLCPRNMLLVIMKCTMTQCGAFEIKCAKVLSGKKFKVVGRSVTMSKVVSNDASGSMIPYAKCPEGFVANGILCPSFGCRFIALHCVRLDYFQ